MRGKFVTIDRSAAKHKSGASKHYLAFRSTSTQTRAVPCPANTAARLLGPWLNEIVANGDPLWEGAHDKALALQAFAPSFMTHLDVGSGAVIGGQQAVA